MDASEFRELMSPEGLRLLDSLPPYETVTDVVRTVSQLRAQGHAPGLVAAVLTQSKLRARASAKFGPFAERMLFTEAGLEQATRLQVAALHAGRYARAGMRWVADLGCGIGADAMALASLELEVTAVERDEVTAAIAAYNLAPWPAVHVEHGDAEQASLSGKDAVWLDPARRSRGRRLSDPADWSPSLDFAFGLAAERPIGVKLSPAIDHALLPDGAETQWVSADGEVVEAVVWTGALARPGIRRSAVVLRDGVSAELTAPDDAPDEAPGPLGEWLYEPDGATIRARLVGDVARIVHARPVRHDIAYLTGDAVVETPFAQRFRIEAELPLDVKTLRRELAARDVGVLEIKKRGVDVDPAEFRTRLSLQGSRSATLVLTRAGDRRVALLAHRA